MLQRIAKERDEKARIEREAAAKSADEARVQAEQKRAEIAAAKKRDEDERRAKLAEDEQKAKALSAERKAAEAKQKAEDAERNKVAAESAKLRAESERQAREAETERQKASQASAIEATCKQEQTKFDALAAKGSENAGLDDMKTFAKTVNCERLRPQVATMIDKFTTEANKRTAAMPNSPELLRGAQTQLARLGCFSAKPDGILNAATKTGLARYLTVKNQPSSETPPVTEALVASLTKETDRVCPLECKSGETVKDNACVADKPVATPAPSASRRKDRDDEDDAPAKRKPAPRTAEREAPRRAAPAPEPRARQQASSRPSGGGGGGGGGHTMIGVGF